MAPAGSGGRVKYARRRSLCDRAPPPCFRLEVPGRRGVRSLWIAPVRPDDEDGDTWGARLPDADAMDPEQDVSTPRVSPPVVDRHVSRSGRRRAGRVVPSFRSCVPRGSGRRAASGCLFPGARPPAGGSCVAEAPGVGSCGASAGVPSVFVCALSALSCLSSCIAGVGVFVRPSRKSADTRNSCAALLSVCIRIEPRPFSIFETLEWSNRSPSAAASSDWFSPACFRQRASRLPRSLVPIRGRRRLARFRRGCLLRFFPCIASS